MYEFITLPPQMTQLYGYMTYNTKTIDTDCNRRTQEKTNNACNAV